MSLVILLLLTITYALFAWRSLAWALSLLIFLLPSYQVRFQVGPVPLTLLEAMVMVLFTVWLIQAIRRKELPLLDYLSFPRRPRQILRGQNVKPYPFGYELIAMLIIAFVAVGVGGFTPAAFGIFKAYFLEAAMFFIVFVNVFKSPQHRPKIFWALAGSALFVSLVAIYQKFTGQLLPADWVDSGRVTSVFAYPNALGLYLGPITVLLTGYTLSLSAFPLKAKQPRADSFPVSQFPSFPIVKILLFCLFVFLPLVSIYFAKSEGALVGVAVAVAVMGLLYNKRSRMAVAGILVVGAVVIGLNADWRHETWKKITLMDTDGQIRRQQWVETGEMLRAGRWLTGAGLANYQTAVAPYHASGIYVRNDDAEFDKWVAISLEYQQAVWQPLEIYLYPHNILLNFWSELGLAGMLLFVWIIGKFLAGSYQITAHSPRHRALALGLAGAMIVIAVHGLVDVPYFKNDLALLFWMLVGMLGVYSIEIDSKMYESDTK